MADERDERAAPAGASGPAFAAAAGDPALHEELRDYLLRQSELATIQIEEARREDVVRHWSLRVRHVSDVLKLGLELAAAFIVLVIALGIGFAIWQAAHADGLVIRSFDVPAPMVEKGLTGQVIANKLLDRAVFVEVNQLVLHRTPQSFHKDVVQGTVSAVHAHRNAQFDQRASKYVRRVLGALVCVKNLRAAAQ